MESMAKDQLFMTTLRSKGVDGVLAVLDERDEEETRLRSEACSAPRLPGLRGRTNETHSKHRMIVHQDLLAIEKRSDHPRICRRFNKCDDLVTLGL